MTKLWLAMLRPMHDLDGRSGDGARAADQETVQTVTGRYAYIPNPCTTEPCLPGMTYAVLVDNTPYFVTRGNRSISDAISYEGYTPEINDIVSVKGRIEQRKDTSGNTFHTVEVISIRPAR